MRTSKGIQTMTQVPIGDLINKLNHRTLSKTTSKNPLASHLLSTWLNLTLRMKNRYPIGHPEISSKASRGKQFEATIWFIKDRP
jgi:hypothetical protein